MSSDLVQVGFKNYRDLDELVTTISPMCGLEKGGFIRLALFNLAEEWYRNGTVVGKDFVSNPASLIQMRQKAGLLKDGE